MAGRSGALPAPDPAAVLAAAAGGLAEELARALQAAAGKPVKAGAPEVASLSAAELGGKLTEKSAAFCLELGGSLQGRAAIVLPGKAVAALAGLLAGGPPEALPPGTGAELSDQDIEGLSGTVAGALAGLAEKLSPHVGEPPELGLGDALLVEPGSPAELLKLVGRGPYPAAAFTLEVEGLASGPAMVLFPASFEVLPDAGGAAPAAAGEPGVAAAIQEAGPLDDLHPNIRRILRLRLQVSVLLAEKTMDLDAVLKLNPGTILEFNKSADENLDLVVNGQRIGAGEAVTIGERFGIQLRQIEGIQQRIRKMGATVQ